MASFPTRELQLSYWRQASRRGRRQRANVCGRAGFTIVEVLLTLVLLAAAYAITLPLLSRGRISASVHNARHVTISSLALARATAVRFGRPAVLRLDTAGDHLWIEADTTLAGSRAGVDTIAWFSFREDLGIDLKANRSAVCFDGRGVGTKASACPSPGALIVVSLRDRSDTIAVSSLGRVLP